MALLRRQQRQKRLPLPKGWFLYSSPLFGVYVNKDNINQDRGQKSDLRYKFMHAKVTYDTNEFSLLIRKKRKKGDSRYKYDPNMVTLDTNSSEFSYKLAIFSHQFVHQSPKYEVTCDTNICQQR